MYFPNLHVHISSEQISGGGWPLVLKHFQSIVYLERGRLFYKASVRPVILYGAECWAFSRADEVWWMCSKGQIIGGVGSTGNSVTCLKSPDSLSVN
jgi:hypothetical protein